MERSAFVMEELEMEVKVHVIPPVSPSLSWTLSADYFPASEAIQAF